MFLPITRFQSVVFKLRNTSIGIFSDRLGWMDFGFFFRSLKTHVS